MKASAGGVVDPILAILELKLDGLKWKTDEPYFKTCGRGGGGQSCGCFLFWRAPWDSLHGTLPYKPLILLIHSDTQPEKAHEIF